VQVTELTTERRTAFVNRIASTPAVYGRGGRASVRVLPPDLMPVHPEVER
jgi:hypothetical protein